MRRAVRTCLAAAPLAVALVTGRALAQNPDEAPAPCRAQVQNALERLAPAFAGKARKVAARSPGSIEAAIWGYAPPRFHGVDEGALPSVKTGAACPAEMALVAGRFCVDRWEGSIVVRDADGTEAPHSPYLPPPADKVTLAKSVAGVVPQAYISAKQAESACRASGKRLCQPVEWRAACGGSEGTAYPYGPKRVAGKCHDTGVSPMLTFHLATMKRGWGLTELNDTRNNQLEGTVAKTGAFPDCVSDQGVYDMVGNLHEWTADTNGTFQGGYWLDTSQHGDGCAYRTIAHGYTYHDYSTGFRCCADAGVTAR
ncbi:MAG: SUMF1/EgtB/PvdO family nonheme iron enzyme [Labilithrix sp.]|nr:SUMF1/EgtB/PvdO family nonheme iron enzyme [Labilithrix sp.]